MKIQDSCNIFRLFFRTVYGFADEFPHFAHISLNTRVQKEDEKYFVQSELHKVERLAKVTQGGRTLRICRLLLERRLVT